MKASLTLAPHEIDRVIEMAWEDEIEKLGFKEGIESSLTRIKKNLLA